MSQMLLDPECSMHLHSVYLGPKVPMTKYIGIRLEPKYVLYGCMEPRGTS